VTAAQRVLAQARSSDVLARTQVLAALADLAFRTGTRSWPIRGSHGHESEPGIDLRGLLLASCGRAPSFDVLGSFFPAWLVCLASGLLLTVISRWLLLRLHVVIAVPILTYPSLTALFTFTLWLAFFR